MPVAPIAAAPAHRDHRRLRLFHRCAGSSPTHELPSLLPAGILAEAPQAALSGVERQTILLQDWCCGVCTSSSHARQLLLNPASADVWRQADASSCKFQLRSTYTGCCRAMNSQRRAQLPPPSWFCTVHRVACPLTELECVTARRWAQTTGARTQQSCRWRCCPATCALAAWTRGSTGAMACCTLCRCAGCSHALG